MTPKEINIPTLQWVVDEMKRDRESYIKWKTRNAAFICAMDEMINTFAAKVKQESRKDVTKNSDDIIEVLIQNRITNLELLQNPSIHMLIHRNSVPSEIFNKSHNDEMMEVFLIKENYPMEARSPDIVTCAGVNLF
mgnify:CR=1 FL=1